MNKDKMIEFAREQCEIFPEDSYMGEYLRETLKMLQAEPCGDAISRADVKKYLAAPDANGDRVIYESDLDLLPPVKPKQEWIPVSERLPKSQGDIGDKDYSDWVLVSIKINPYQSIVCSAYYCFSEKKWNMERFGEIVAWKPLPKPYNKFERSKKWKTKS